jgi:hypothetical protein
MAERKHKFLSAADRRKMPSGEFALPGHGEGPGGKGAGAYPIPDEAHARNALARGAQHASSAELATIKRKVHEKFPGIEISGADKAKRRYSKMAD